MVVTHTLCHPLCSCDTCEQYQRRGHWESKPTAYTRDERGYTGSHHFIYPFNFFMTLIEHSLFNRNLHYTALHLASIYGHTSVLEVLLEGTVDVNATEYRGFTSLHLASLRGHHNAVVFYLKSFFFLYFCLFYFFPECNFKQILFFC